MSIDSLRRRPERRRPGKGGHCTTAYRSTPAAQAYRFGPHAHPGQGSPPRCADTPASSSLVSAAAAAAGVSTGCYWPARPARLWRIFICWSRRNRIEPGQKRYSGSRARPSVRKAWKPRGERSGSHGDGNDGSGDGAAGGGDDNGDEARRRVAFIEGDAGRFRALTSLDAGEARDLHRQAELDAARRACTTQGRRGVGGGGGGAGDGASGTAPAAGQKRLPYERFLMALALARNGDEALVDCVFRAPSGTAQAALDDVLPFLLSRRDLPRRFARRLVPLGYRMPTVDRKRKECGDLRDYMGAGGGPPDDA